MFYLGSVRYMNEALKHAQAGDTDASGTALVEGLSFYRSIQPAVAQATTAADEAMLAYFESAPSELTAGKRDAALAALNRDRHGALTDAGRPRDQLPVGDNTLLEHDGSVEQRPA